MRRNTPAFSLTEILIALGLFGIAVSALLVLFPVIQGSERESDEQTRAVLIASSVMDLLGDPAPTAPRGSARVAMGMNHGSPLWKEIHAGNSNTVTIAYDAGCQPVRQLNPEETGTAIIDTAVSSVMTLTLSQKASTPSLVKAEVSVASPASAPPANRHVRRFVRLLAVP